jgi:hypothetical protein
VRKEFVMDKQESPASESLAEAARKAREQHEADIARRQAEARVAWLARFPKAGA